MNWEKPKIKRLFLKPDGDFKWWVTVSLYAWFFVLVVLLLIEIIR